MFLMDPKILSTNQNLNWKDTTNYTPGEPWVSLLKTGKVSFQSMWLQRKTKLVHERKFLRQIFMVRFLSSFVTEIWHLSINLKTSKGII